MSNSDIDRFAHAVERHIFPVAMKYGLRYECIEDRIYSLSSRAVAVKIYFPECHGYDVTVCLSPTLERAWNAEKERGLVWFLRFLGNDAQLPDRVGTIPFLIGGLVSKYATPLSEVLDHFVEATPDLWRRFFEFYEKGAAEEMARRSFTLNLAPLPFSKKDPNPESSVSQQPTQDSC